MKSVIQRITKIVGPIYRGSVFYKHTIWPHALRVSGFAQEFAVKIGANQFVAEAGGLLHDLGAAIYGREDHHITGVKESAQVLIASGCPLKFFGPILYAVYSHRGSQKISLRTLAAKCVAAADAKDHFTLGGLEELWMSRIRDLGLTEMEAHKRVSEELENDWEKICPEIRLLLDGTYKKARQELLRMVSDNKPRGRGKVSA